ncbi:hypothetical protein LWI29_035631 [Acer saccharum]|uniref:Retrotransposon gag domain-containing protein n=1 Tax=Acer saccharum TaxID=4024 RepID=A0AA39SJA4_ACESA|nr:hypothetical protein LWI29_035631 [Acer saccharum]
MGSVQRRKSLAHLSNLKQERNESIKKYLARFGKEVAQIKDASDVAVIAAFTNGLQSGRLSFDLRRWHLKDFALKGDKHGGRQDNCQGNMQERKSPRSSPNATINTIFGGPHIGRSNRERMSEVREVMYESRSMEINSVQRNPKKGREGHDPIMFTAELRRIDVKPNDAIVVGVRIAHRDVLRVMIDNGSSTDILSARVYDELRLDRKDLEPFHVPLKGFGGAEVRSLGTVKLPVRFVQHHIPANDPTGLCCSRHP